MGTAGCIDKRHGWPSLLLVLALAVLGFQTSGGKVPAGDNHGAVVGLAQKQVLVLRSAPTGPVARKAQPHCTLDLACPAAPLLVCAWQAARLRTLQSTVVGGTLRDGDQYGRAPPGLPVA